MTLPFEVSFEYIQAHPEAYIQTIFASLVSEFLVMPRGRGFIEYPVFEYGYEALKRATAGFREVTPTTLEAAVTDTPMALIVLRAMLGFTPPEWAYMATQRTGVAMSQGAVRALDRKIRMEPLQPLGQGKVTRERICALLEVACQLLTEGPKPVEADKIHRLEKADTKAGIRSLHALAELGVPYAMLLYERFLGRPFAGHRDSVSELVGDVMESAIENVLSAAGISYRKTKRAESIVGFDQAPDFIIPSEFNPQVVIEAKITEDDGTARDKVTRVQHLDRLSTQGQQLNQPRFEVVACIGGRGFSIRREDMRKLLYATKGKVFTLNLLDKLVEYTRLKEFKTTPP